MVTLVRDSLSRDVIELFDQLAVAARDGIAVGAIVGIALKGRRYVVNCAGTLAKDPTLARGVAAALDDELGRMVQGQADTDTTR